MKFRFRKAIIDLSTGQIKIEEEPLSLIKKFLGGRGLNVYHLYQETRAQIDPFDSKNALMVGAGLLTGTPAPSSSRLNISAKSPETGFLGDSNIGGFFGPAMRKSGFDLLIIKGRSEQPVFLHLTKNKIQIQEAKKYWGLDTQETQISLKSDYGPNIKTICIGPAGENLVRFASIISGKKNAAGRTGMGAVMGSKNLKALVAGGRSSIPIFAKKELKELRDQMWVEILKTGAAKILSKHGTPFLYNQSNALGAIRTLNTQFNQFEDSLNCQYFEEYVMGSVGCYGCRISCRRKNIFGGEGPEYSSIGALGANCGIADPRQIIHLANLCNELGLDTVSTGAMISWATELFQKGIIDKNITKGLELNFGNFNLIKKLINSIAHRKNFGDILAEGTQIAKVFGEKSRDYLIAVKNLPQSDPHDVRYIKSFALGIATASRGADHLRSRPTLDIFNFPQNLLEKIYGQGISSDPASYQGKEKAVIFSEIIYAVIDSLGICKFICHGFNSPNLLNFSQLSHLIKLATGLGLDESDLKQVGKNIIDLERIYNLREGLKPEDDLLPRRYFEEEMPLGPVKGHKIDRKKFSQLLEAYYAQHSWNLQGQPCQTRRNFLLR